MKKLTKEQVLVERIDRLNGTQARIALRKLIQEERISPEYAEKLFDVAESYS